MPRVDDGMYIVDIADIMRVEERGLEELTSWAVSAGALFITSPSIVPVKGRVGAVRLSVGVGSLVSAERPPLRHYVVASPEWVDACAVGQKEPTFRVASGPQYYLKGVAIALDTSLPVATMLNSLPAEGEFVDPGEGYPALVVEGEGRRAIALSVSQRGLTLSAVSGRVWSLLKYGLTLYTSCPGGPS